LAGLGFWYEASIGTFFVIVSHLILRPVENKIESRSFGNDNHNIRYKLLIKCDISVKDEVRINLFNITDKYNYLKINSYNVEFETNNSVVIDISLKSNEKADQAIAEINTMLNGLNEIHSINWDIFE
jgi:putative Mg2+ transporter-C (MgtC) family protein